MVDVQMAGRAVVFLDELLERIEALTSECEELECSGRMTPEIETWIEEDLGEAQALLPMIRELVCPSLTPMLRVKRLAKAGKMLANGVPADKIRSEFQDLVGRLGCQLPEEQCLQPGRLLAVTFYDVLIMERI